MRISAVESTTSQTVMMVHLPVLNDSWNKLEQCSKAAGETKTQMCGACIHTSILSCTRSRRIPSLFSFFFPGFVGSFLTTE